MDVQEAIAAGYAAATVEEANAAIAALQPFLELDDDLAPKYPEAWSASEQAATVLEAVRAEQEAAGARAG